jgi:hypothetical protein
MTPLAQNGVVALAVIAAAAWLIRRRIRLNRAKAPCEQCAAAYLRTVKRPDETPSRVSIR